MMFFRRKKEKEPNFVEKLVKFVNDPIAAVVFSLATALTMAGFTSGKFLYEYSNTLNEAIDELKTLQQELKQIKADTSYNYYPRAELDLKIKILEEKIKQLDSRIVRLESSIFD